MIPLHREWNDVIFLVCMPRLFPSSFHSWEMNCLSRSEMIFIVALNFEIHLNKTFQEDNVVVSLNGIASGQHLY